MKTPTPSDYGKRAAGIPKRFTKAELAKRSQRLAVARAKRWQKRLAKQREDEQDQDSLMIRR